MSVSTVQKVFPSAKVFKAIPQFLLDQVSVYGFMWRPLILLGLSFVQCDRYGSIHILLHAVIQMTNTNCFSAVLSSECISGFLLKCQVSTGGRIYVWVFISILMISNVFVQIPCCFYCYNSVVQLEIGNGDISNSSYSFQGCLISRWFWIFFLYTFRSLSFQVWLSSY